MVKNLTKHTTADDAPATNFWIHKTVAQLAREQGVQPVTDPTKLLGGWPDEIDDGFDEALAAARS